MGIYLGLDSSTQSLSGLAIDTESKAVVFEHSIVFTRDLPQYGTENGVLRGPGGEAWSPPLLWVEALDRLMAAFASSGVDLRRLVAVSGAGQQHGTVYLKEGFSRRLAELDARRPLHEQLQDAFSRAHAPIWLDASSAEECREIEEAAQLLGGLTALSGSPATLRFSGPQIRKFAKQESAAYAATARIHLVSSFICSLLLGADAPIDHGDGSGMNLMDLKARDWHPRLIAATAAGLSRRLPPLVAPNTFAGNIGRTWVERYGLPAAARVLVFSGDNPCTLVGLGLTEPGLAAISLGTSDTNFAVAEELRVSPSGEGHVFVSPSGGYMSLICYANGSLAREKVRAEQGLDWNGFEAALEESPPGNRGKLMLPYFCEEITPLTRRAQVYRFGLAASDAAGQCRAIFEAQALSQRLHSRHLPSPKMLYATGGASRNRALMQVFADVFGVPVRRLRTQAGASLGAALRAFQADSGKPWAEATRDFVTFETAIAPRPVAHSCYGDLLPIYEACEDFALRGGKDPEARRLEFMRRWS